MKLKEAITRLKQIVFDHTGDTAINVVLEALLASQMREREVFKRLCVQCIYNEPRCAGDKCTKNNYELATMRTCPLLAKQKKEIK